MSYLLQRGELCQNVDDLTNVRLHHLMIYSPQCLRSAKKEEKRSAKKERRNSVNKVKKDVKQAPKKERMASIKRAKKEAALDYIRFVMLAIILTPCPYDPTTLTW